VTCQWPTTFTIPVIFFSKCARSCAPITGGRQPPSCPWFMGILLAVHRRVCSLRSSLFLRRTGVPPVPWCGVSQLLLTMRRPLRQRPVSYPTWRNLVKLYSFFCSVYFFENSCKEKYNQRQIDITVNKLLSCLLLYILVLNSSGTYMGICWQKKSVMWNEVTVKQR
jgi:hypothetical protein